MDSKDNPIDNTTELMAKSKSRQTNINDLSSNILEKIFTRKTIVWCGKSMQKMTEMHQANHVSKCYSIGDHKFSK